ncbi:MULTISPECIES: RES family NAD+ phosphorylase [unclassified Mucilaginibacter]|uniref:RES family NAD+ phosphorylase n=1 Tax=unclassified Mucilaginibacter TaxID=2617802 RepID=UPI002AC8D780|nr:MULTISPECIES: RES family NAD+ phosphorylase [unclassified Mucilaginibacter]MEB0277066.1 RES family NAD+ phosphorylase [Mucilaginibacter sp. 10B2]MEB0302186.1 RES family NAD+ phosphorylase [Mucilaginibacter sp. 5C4]WPX25167.1 RES family NAD+ phosphorylase [Mucilaginibacter sp. 5C4]
MILYRIANCNYIKDLNGTGARLYGGRWNSEGKSMVYLASSRALAVLEVLVHLPPLLLPNNFCITEIEVPEHNILTLDVKTLPANWQDASSPAELKTLGNQFIKETKYLMMKVPSSVVPEEYNYLLNPWHTDIKKVSIISTHPFSFDNRLL